MPTTTIVHVPESERLRPGKGSGAHSKFCFALHLAGTTIMQPGVQQTFHLGRSSSFLSFGTIGGGGGRAACCYGVVQCNSHTEKGFRLL